MIARLLILIARGWPLGPSRILPPTCRSSPSCSDYALLAIRRHGASKGGRGCARVTSGGTKAGQFRVKFRRCPGIFQERPPAQPDRPRLAARPLAHPAPDL